MVLYTYTITEEGEKMGLEDVRKQKTGLMQWTLQYVEKYQEMVEDGIDE